jgi:hypothetical protein
MKGERFMGQLALAVQTEFGGGDGDDPWTLLEGWLDASDGKFAEITRRRERDPSYDPWDDEMDWEADRSTLLWALKTEPATTLHSLRLKARVSQTPFCQLDAAGRSREGRAIAESIVSDLRAMTVAGALSARPALAVVR